jgi:hypothetical protein
VPPHPPTHPPIHPSTHPPTHPPTHHDHHRHHHHYQPGWKKHKLDCEDPDDLHPALVQRRAAKLGQNEQMEIFEGLIRKNKDDVFSVMNLASCYRERGAYDPTHTVKYALGLCLGSDPHSETCPQSLLRKLRTLFDSTSSFALKFEYVYPIFIVVVVVRVLF